jgi:exodeoxyribonuclease VII small subunit
MTTPSTSADLDSLTFEQLLDELESVTRQIESREIGIEAATDLYEQAGLLHAAATQRLARVEDRIRSIDDAQSKR